MSKPTLANGERVKEGDLVAFINSDGERCEDIIRARPNGTLYFWNNRNELKDYPSAFLVAVERTHTKRAVCWLRIGRLGWSWIRLFWRLMWRV